MLKYHGIPAFITMLTGSLIIAIQHTGEGSLLKGRVTTFLRRLVSQLESCVDFR
jgi:hypothetical protein